MMGCGVYAYLERYLASDTHSWEQLRELFIEEYGSLNGWYSESELKQPRSHND